MKNNTIDQATHKPKISFSIRLDGKMYFVLIENIAFIYLDNETVYLLDFSGNKHNINKTISELENLLPTQQFYRINRQMIVNRQAIKEVEPYANQRISLQISIPTPEQIIVPRLKVTHFLHWVENG